MRCIGGAYQMGEKSDNELVSEIKAGQEDSFAELTNRHAGRVYNLALRLVKTEQDAEEVLQDVFVTIYRKIQGFEGKSSFSSWLYRVTVNAALMKIRSNNSEQSIAIADAFPKTKNLEDIQRMDALDTDDEAFRRELSFVLEDAIKVLPDEYRPVFVLRDVDGLSSREVSEALKVSIPAVKSRLHRSRFLLREKLTEFYREYCESDKKCTHSCDRSIEQ
ncbi:MAG: RNA polymerase sigma factor [Bdellovibrionota bacterium]